MIVTITNWPEAAVIIGACACAALVYGTLFTGKWPWHRD